MRFDIPLEQLIPEALEDHKEPECLMVLHGKDKDPAGLIFE